MFADEYVYAPVSSMLFMLAMVTFECSGEEDSVMHGFERVVYNCAATVVQLY